MVTGKLETHSGLQGFTTLNNESILGSFSRRKGSLRCYEAAVELTMVPNSILQYGAFRGLLKCYSCESCLLSDCICGGSALKT
jgi:hypothetical protein